MMIKPCPFCGCEPLRHHPDDDWEECSFCGARGPDMSRDAGQEIFHQEDELPWNIRSPLTVADALEIPEVRALIDAVNEPPGDRPACVQQGRIIEAAHALAAKATP
jgi:hypothetical protein